MSVPKVGKAANGQVMHYSVGAVIEKDGKYLLIERAQPPLGFAGVAGHVDEGEDALTALVREVEEESGLKVAASTLLFEEELDWNWCSKGIQVHYWHLYTCAVSGKVKRNTRETKSLAWYSKEDIKTLPLEPAWNYWFKKLKIL